MLIFNRSPNLLLGAVTAVFNVVVVFHILGFNPTPEQIATVNVAFGSIIALIANNAATAIAAGDAAHRNRRTRNGDST